MSTTESDASKTAIWMIRRRAFTQLAGGVVVVAIPVAAWWYWARSERHKVAEEFRTAVRLPAGAAQDTYDFLITEKCQPGDVLVFDRRCQRCAAGPWAALSCLTSRALLTDPKSHRSVDTGLFDHIGLIVPGYINSRADAYDPTNLLVLEATPSGIVTRPLKQRLEQSASRSVILLQLNCPGEQRRNVTTDEKEQSLMVQRTRQHIERELRQFRDRWVALGEEKGYKWMHSTLGLGGAIAYGLGMQNYTSGPTSPSAYLVLMGLHKAAVAQNISEKENLQIKVEDFLRDHRFEEKHSVRLRPGFRYSPIPMKETSKYG